MEINMSTFGDIERTFADLYEYRWAIGAGVLVFLAAVAAFGYWKHWHLVIWRHRLLVSVISAPVLVLTIWLGWSLGSPLFTNVTVEEEFPFAFQAVIPSGMEMVDVEMIMAGMAEIQQPVNEAMPESSEMATSGSAKLLVMQDSDLAMLTQGIDTMKQAMANADALKMDEGLGMISSAVATMKDQPKAEAGQQSAAVALKTGNFMDADSFHKGSGTATIYRGPDGSYLLRLEDLAVTNGPDLHVILSPHESPESRNDVHTPGYVDLGKLKGNKGNQNYEIPGGVDIAANGSMIIYCKPFSVVFSVAQLVDLGTS